MPRLAHLVLIAAVACLFFVAAPVRGQDTKQAITLVTTQCSGWPCRYNSVLDFVFAAGPAQKWQAESEIVVVPGDFPDDKAKSGHRGGPAPF